MAACCDACARGAECSGAGCNGGHGELSHSGAGNPAKPSGEARAHPLVQRQRAITGSHPAPSSSRRRASGDVDMDFSNDPGAGANRDRADADFLALLDRTPESERAALVREHLRSQGASEEAIRSGVSSLVNGGIGALNAYLRNELETARENIRAGAQVNQEAVRQNGQTERERIAAETARLDRESRERIERERIAAGGSTNGLPPPNPTAPAPTNWAIPVGGLILAGLAAWALTRDTGSR